MPNCEFPAHHRRVLECLNLLCAVLRCGVLLQVWQWELSTAMQSPLCTYPPRDQTTTQHRTDAGGRPALTRLAVAPRLASFTAGSFH